MSQSPLTATAAESVDAPLGRFDIRLAIALVLSNMLWLIPLVAGIALLVPARLEQVAPDEKVAAIASLAITGSIVALVANIFFGALSDRTRSRFGKRTPWIVFGSLTSAAAFVGLAFAPTVGLIVFAWCVFQFFLNAIVAPLIAVIPDRVAEKRRGTFSAVYGLGAVAGVGLAGLVASPFVANPQFGLLVMGGMLLMSGPLFALLAPDTSSADEPRASLSARSLLHSFSFPIRGSRDFYLAGSGKLLFVLAIYAINGYQLYILTDHFSLDPVATAGMIALVSGIQTIVSLLTVVIAGPLSDRINRRKMPVVAASLLTAVGSLTLFFWTDSAAMIVFAVLALGIGFGIYSSVDQALNYRVLPDPATAAKDLGILNMANTGGQILGPVVMSFAVLNLGGYGPGFLISAIIAAASAILIGLIRSTR